MPFAEIPLEDSNMSRAVLLLGAGHLSFFDHAAVTNTEMSDYAEVSSFVDEKQLPQTPQRATLVFP